MSKVRRVAVTAIAVAGLAAVSIATPAIADSLGTDNATANKADQKPVYNKKFADPAVMWTGEEYVGVATGGKAPMATAPSPRGPWKHKHAGLTKLPGWSAGGGVWAPEIQHVKDDTYVMFYSTKVAGLQDNNQRCIGVAVSKNGPAARYSPVGKKPLVCPPGSKHPGLSKPVTGGVGFIDTSTFQSKNGRNILLFKSQKPNPGTKLWSVELNDDWTKPTSASKVMLSRAKGQIENPEMVVTSSGYYLFASYDNWADCSYKTVWLKNKSPRAGWNFSKGFPKTSSQGGVLIKSKNGMCGTGGMTITKQGDQLEFFMHAYRDANHNGKKDSDVRRMYGGKLGFGSKGVPKIQSFYSPA